MKEGWTYKRFDEIMTPAKVERCGNRDDLPVLSITMRGGIVEQNERFKKTIASLDRTNYKVVKNGQLVIAFPIDEGLLYTQNVAPEGIMSPAYNIWDVDYSVIDRKFLVSYFHSRFAFSYYKAKLRGSTQRRRSMDKEDLLSMPIPVPPLEIQQQIVAELDLLSSVIEKQKNQLEDLDKLTQSIFYDMFGDPITNDKGWHCSIWDDCLTIQNGKNQSQVEDQEGLYPICGSGGIMSRANDYICPENTVIIGRKGNIDNPIIMKEKFWIVDTAFGLVSKEQLKPDYLFYFCKCFNFQKLNVAVTIPSLRKTDLLKINMPLPPLALQQEFAAKVEAIEAMKAKVRQSLKEAEKLFNSRMDYYFN